MTFALRMIFDIPGGGYLKHGRENELSLRRSHSGVDLLNTYLLFQTIWKPKFRKKLEKAPPPLKMQKNAKGGGAFSIEILWYEVFFYLSQRRRFFERMEIFAQDGFDVSVKIQGSEKFLSHRLNKYEEDIRYFIFD